MSYPLCQMPARRDYRAVFLAGALAAFVAAPFAASPLSANVKDGVEAWSAGQYDRAVAEWQGPAMQGDADALFNLAQAYRLGRGVEADIAKARDYYAQAAQKGHIKAADNFGLLLFQQGEQAIAMPLIEAAAKRGDPRAQYVLGLAHFNADYAEKDWVRAYALLTLAQGSGLPQAAGALGQMDQYVPLENRQQAQQLARQLEDDAAQARAALLTAADLGAIEESAPPGTIAGQQGPAAPTNAARAPRVAAASGPVAAPGTSAAASSAPASSAAEAPVERAARQGPWRLQLGAFSVAANADNLWAKLSDNPALRGTSKSLQSAGGVTRLHALGFESRTAASRACASLKAQGASCLVKAPQG